MEVIILIVVVVVAAMGLFLKFGVTRITILEYEKGLKYAKGKFASVVEPGQYWYIPFFTIIHKLDIRPRYVSITGQEVLSADGVTLKVSLAANFEIMEPNIAINKVQSFQDALYLELQLALREIIGASDIDTVLSGRTELSKKLMESTATKVSDLGLSLISVNLKDVMFPGKLKDIFAQVVDAKKESLAALERARGETAALRHLANAAKMIDQNPNLMQLRILQTLGEASGNTFVLGMPPVPIPVTMTETADPKKNATEDS